MVDKVEMYSEEDVAAYKRAYDCGASLAKSFKLGDVFKGAFGHADDTGYAREGFLRSCFITGFLNHLSAPVVVDRNNRLVQYGKSQGGSHWHNPATLQELETALDAGMLYVPMTGGRFWQARRNGKTVTWKTRPGEFRLPVKFGLKGYHSITRGDMAQCCIANSRESAERITP